MAVFPRNPTRSPRLLGRRTGRAGAGLLCAGLLLGGLPADLALGQPANPAERIDPAELPPQVRAAYVGLISQNADLSERHEAVERLLRLHQERGDEAELALRSATSAAHPPAVGLAVLTVVGASLADTPRDLGPYLFDMGGRLGPQGDRLWAAAAPRFTTREVERAIREAAMVGTPATRARYIDALSYLRTVRAAETLVQLIDAVQPVAVQEDALRALGRMTALPYGADRKAWTQWWQESQDLEEAEWTRRLLQQVTRAQERAETREQELVDRLIESQRALYRTTAPDDRAGVLVFMLADALEPIRVLAIALAEQRLLDDLPFDGELRSGLRAGLSDESPLVRQRAAAVLRDLSDAPAADRVANRLADRAEGDPAVLQAALSMMARLPRQASVEPAMDLLDDRVLRPDAAAALSSAARVGVVTDAQKREVRATLDRILSAAGPVDPPIIALLGQVIDANDDRWERVVRWLDDPRPEVRETAARAWAESPHSLLEIAIRSADPVIQPVVLSAANRRGSEAATLRALAERPPTRPALDPAWRDALVATASRVQPPTQALPIATALPDDERGLRLADRILTAAIDRPGQELERDEASLRLLLERGGVRERLDDPQSAVRDFERVAVSADQLSPASRDDLYRGLARAYLAADRINEALASTRVLLADPQGRIPAAAIEDPLVEMILDGAQQRSEAGQFAVAQSLVSGLREMLATSIKPELASRMRDLEADIDRRRARFGQPGSDSRPVGQPDRAPGI
ncbi:MAG: hypothetical protein AAF288_05760 [Planctomycetota bacterium]